MGNAVAGFVAVASLVVVAGIVFQVVNGKHSAQITQSLVGGATNITGTLFKS